MYLMAAGYHYSCEKLVTDAMLPPNLVLGAASFAVTLDEKTSTVLIAQDKIVFPGLSSAAREKINSVVLMSCMGTSPGAIGRDMIHNMVKMSEEGQDLVVYTKEDRSIWGI